MRVLVANELRTYREVIVDAFRELRPHIEVRAAEPDVLGVEVKRLCPHLVVCSRASVAALAGPLTWVMLYPDGENRAEIISVEKRTTIAGIGYGDHLSILDETEILCRSI